MKSILAALFIFSLFSASVVSANNQTEALEILHSGKVRTDALIVKLKPNASSTSLSVHNLAPQPLFRELLGSFRPMSSQSTPFENELAKYKVIHFPAALSIEDAQKQLLEISQNPDVESAFYEPIFEDAGFVKQTVSHDPAQTLGNFEDQQFHLKPAPTGVDAQYAWTVEGGTGKGIRVMDLETGWYTEHREFKPVYWDNQQNQHKDHGTAVWGLIGAKRDNVGVTGIAYDIDYAIAGTGYHGDEVYENLVSERLSEAIAQMKAGEILVIEQHVNAPEDGNYVPIEYFEPLFKLMKYATSMGIHCISAAGNGGVDLDSGTYKGVFNLNVRDSGCIMVGAGGPPTQESHLQMLDFSNHGSRVDAFGYGDAVVTTGYGDLYAADNSSNYTAEFSGTSSATPMVVGAVASVLGIAKAQNRVITPKEMRDAIRMTGTQQKGVVGNNHIGNLPNIHELVTHFGLEK
jgi:serine protease